MSEQEKKSSYGKLFMWLAIWIMAGGLLATIIIPNLIPARVTGGGLPRPCILNLRLINDAAKQFALEHGKTNGEAIHYPNDLTPYIKLNSAGKIPPCPQGGTYHIAKVGEIPTCSLGTTVTPAHVLP